MVLIEVLGLTYDDTGNIKAITVTDGDKVRDVTPEMLFDALLENKMESNTSRLAIHGLDVLVNRQEIAIQVPLTAAKRKVLKLRLGIPVETPSEKRQQQINSKEAKLAAERVEAHERQQQWFEDNKRKADEARAKGLVKLSPEESRRLRQEAIRNKKQQQD